MWLFTKIGFFSVVQAKDKPSLVQVRARVKEDLERLRLFADRTAGVRLPTTILTPHADYSFRVIVEHRDWNKMAAALSADINYANFKAAVHGESDRDAAYFEVWSAMNDLQWKRR